MNRLADELRRYYNRVGGRVVFINGKSLNQLAWDTWEKLKYSQVDPSVLSRAINGQRGLSIPQIEAFASILGLSKTEIKRLKEARQQDLYEKFGLEEGETISQLATFLLPKIKELREAGWYDMAADLAIELAQRLKMDEKTDYKLFADILMEKYAGVIYVKYDEYIPTDITNVISEMFILGNRYRDREILGMAHYMKSNIYYLKHQFALALKESLKSIEYSPDNKYKWWSTRIAHISSAAVNNQSTWKRTKTTLLNKIPDLSGEAKAALYEGLANSAIRNQDQATAEEYLIKGQTWAKKIKDDKNKNWVLRNVQMARTYAIYRNNFLVSDNEVDKTIKGGLILASDYKFDKYIRQINRC